MLCDCVTRGCGDHSSSSRERGIFLMCGGLLKRHSDVDGTVGGTVGAYFLY